MIYIRLVAENNEKKTIAHVAVFGWLFVLIRDHYPPKHTSSFISDHLEQNGKSTGDITPKSLWKPGEIMSPPPKLRGQTEAATGATRSS